MAANPAPQVPVVPSVWRDALRAVTPWAISVVTTLIAHFGYHVDNALSLKIVVTVGVLLSVLVRVLEKWFPWFGVFLGYIGAPKFAPSSKATLQAQLESLSAELLAVKAQQHEAVSPSPASSAPVVPSSAPVEVAPSATA